jgi:hypothetical protein
MVRCRRTRIGFALHRDDYEPWQLENLKAAAGFLRDAYTDIAYIELKD